MVGIPLILRLLRTPVRVAHAPAAAGGVRSRRSRRSRPACPSSPPWSSSTWPSQAKACTGPIWAVHAPPLAFSKRLFPEGSIPWRRQRQLPSGIAPAWSRTVCATSSSHRVPRSPRLGLEPSYRLPVQRDVHALDEAGLQALRRLLGTKPQGISKL